jgi:hypothetical protein
MSKRADPLLSTALRCLALHLNPNLKLTAVIVTAPWSCDSAALVPHEHCTAAVRCAGSALKTRALADQNTEDSRHLIIINASEDHQRRATTRLQLRWARPRPYIGASTPPR